MRSKLSTQPRDQPTHANHLIELVVRHERFTKFYPRQRIKLWTDGYFRSIALRWMEKAAKVTLNVTNLTDFRITSLRNHVTDLSLDRLIDHTTRIEYHFPAILQCDADLSVRVWQKLVNRLDSLTIEHDENRLIHRVGDLWLLNATPEKSNVSLREYTLFVVSSRRGLLMRVAIRAASPQSVKAFFSRDGVVTCDVTEKEVIVVVAEDTLNFIIPASFA